MNTPTTPAPDSPPAEIPPTRWFYWVTFAARGGTGAVEMSQSEPITRGEHVTALQKTLAQNGGWTGAVITSFTLLRVEDTNGQVIG